MQIVVCPGFHSPALTREFLQVLGWYDCVVPPEQLSPLDGLGIYQQLQDRQPALFVGFSAGVIGAAIAAELWQQQGNTVLGLIAIDGWGVPLISTSFPTYRLSHDRFTHVTSGWGEFGQGRFYCDPPATHLDLWRSPRQAWGWCDRGPGWQERLDAASYLQDVIRRHDVSNS